MPDRPPAPTQRAVFLSYASQDAEAVERIAVALRAAGVEVWFDKSELTGGDAWDAKIRGQIASCALFVPVISANTQARLEGYFRLEWKLAAQRTHTMADEKVFLLPVVIDETRDAEAKVPAEFRAVQWTRLPGGETPEKFCARVKHLLSDAALSGVSPADNRTPAAESGPQASSAAKGRTRSRSWTLTAAVGVGVLVAVLAVVFALRPHRSPEEVAKRVATAPVAAEAATAQPAAAPLSEARQLIAKAWVQLNKQELARAELETADALCKRAAELDPVDATVWATWTHVHSWMTHHRLDRTDSRKAAARDCAARAIRLDAGSFEARLAQAVYWTRGAGAGRGPETDQLLRALVQERPDDPRCLQIAGRYFMESKASRSEGLALLERLAANPNYTALAWVEIGWACHNRDKDMRAALAAAEKSIAAKPFWHNLGLKAQIAAIWLGDPELALATLGQMPQAEQQEDWSVGSRFWILSLGRKPKELLTFLNRVPQEWVSSHQFTGPKSFLVGLAYRDAGADDLARGAFRRGLEFIEKNLAALPHNADLLALRAQTLKYLGDEVEAAKAYRVFRQLRQRSVWDPFLSFEPREVVFARLEKDKYSAAELRLLPALDPWRDDLRFTALLAKADADPMRSPRAPKKESGSVSPPDDKSVAVLPFVNLSEDKGNEYFSDGISEELLTVLQKIPGLQVAAQRSAFSFKGRNVTAQEIGTTLNVAHLVEGSVQKIGNRVKITARLSRVATGEELWAKTFPPQELTDAFAVQSEMAQTIVGELRGRLPGGTAAVQAEIVQQVKAAERGGTKNREAYDAYLQGRFLAKEFSLENMNRVIPLFRRAVSLDPNYALAWSELSLGLARLGGSGLSDRPAPDLFLEARSAADRALALEPELAEGHMALSHLKLTRDLDWMGAAVSARRALALAPSDAAILSHAAWTMAVVGQIDRAIELGQRALTLDPLNIAMRMGLANTVYFAAGKWSEAEAEVRRAINLDPLAVDGKGSLAYFALLDGRIDEASSLLEEFKYDLIRNIGLALVRWAQKRFPEADAALQATITRGDDASFQIAEIYAYRRDFDQAFAWLERAYQVRDGGLWMTRTSPLLVPLHSDPRWPAFLKKIGLSDEQLK